MCTGRARCGCRKRNHASGAARDGPRRSRPGEACRLLEAALPEIAALMVDDWNEAAIRLYRGLDMRYRAVRAAAVACSAETEQGNGGVRTTP